MNLSGSDRYLATKVSTCGLHMPTLYRSPELPRDPLSPNFPLVSHIHSRIYCGGLEVSTPLGTTGCLVPPTRKVQSLRTYRHLRLLTGTPCLIRVIQNSLFMAINDILRNSNSGFLWSIPQSISSTVNIKMPAKFWKNTMQVIGLRTVPIRTEVPFPMDFATAMPCFTPGVQGIVCRNSFPLLPIL